MGEWSPSKSPSKKKRAVVGGMGLMGHSYCQRKSNEAKPYKTKVIAHLCDIVKLLFEKVDPEDISAVVPQTAFG